MISLKRYLDANVSVEAARFTEGEVAQLLTAYRSSMIQMADCGANTCPAHGAELKHGIARIHTAMGQYPRGAQIADAEKALSALLQGWSQQTAHYYRQKAGEVKDLLLVMALTAESLGQKDERYARKFDSVTARLDTIASLDDITTMRASIEESARDLRSSLVQLTAENKAVIDHLHAEVLTYQAKLEKAEYAASVDALTGLGSRVWIEGRILERIESGSVFTILIINIEGFQDVNQDHGSLTGDFLLKEFGRELRSFCRFSDLVARWGGDQFIVVIDGPGSHARAQAARLLGQSRRLTTCRGR